MPNKTKCSSTYVFWICFVLEVVAAASQPPSQPPSEEMTKELVRHAAEARRGKRTERCQGDDFATKNKTVPHQFLYILNCINHRVQIKRIVSSVNHSRCL